MIAISQSLKLILDLPSSVNHIYGRNKFGSTYLKKEGKDYKKRMIEVIKQQVKKQNWIKLENTYLYLDEIIYMNKKGRDADNLKKLTQDCITESDCVWTDDTYCWARTQRVYIDNVNPRLEIILSETPYIGIFNNQNDLDIFIKNNCKVCKKGKNIGQKGGCSIYKKALENRIQEEIITDKDGKRCLKKK